MTTPDHPMAKSHEPRDPAEPCSGCGLPHNAPGSRHNAKAPAGTKCGVNGCTKRPLTECFVGSERVGVWCHLGPHRWRKQA